MNHNRCNWCNVDEIKAALRYEGPHLTWCPHYRRSQVLEIRDKYEEAKRFVEAERDDRSETKP
jgi:hypothetical protein